jgi:formylmethanofuran:tetrahydromethanopterin formyltransferase
VPVKASVASKAVSVALSKTVLAKANHAMQASMADVVPRTTVPQRATAPSVMAMLKTAMIVVATVATSRAGVLKITTGLKSWLRLCLQR